MNQQPAVGSIVAKALIIRYLSPLRGYTPEAVDRLSEALQEYALSVDHAEKSLERFEDQCPTPREIKTVVWDERSAFVPPPEDPKLKWIAEGATYEPDWATSMLGSAAGKGIKQEMGEMHLKAIRDMLYYTEGAGRHEPGQGGFWAGAREYDLKEHFDLIEWIRNGEQGPMPPLIPMSDRARKTRTTDGKPLPYLPPITQAEIDRAREQWERSRGEMREAEDEPPF